MKRALLSLLLVVPFFSAWSQPRQRLVMEVFDDDTSRYAYSGERGSVFDDLLLSYDPSRNLFPGFRYDHEIIFNPHMQQHMFYDSFWYKGQLIDAIQYNNHDQPETIIAQSANSSYSIISYYNAQVQEVLTLKISFYNFPTPHVDTNGFRATYYDASGRVVKDTVANIYPSYVTEYEYDQLGRLSRQTLYDYTYHDTLLYEYTYNSNGLISEVVSYEANTMRPIRKNIFEYGGPQMNNTLWEIHTWSATIQALEPNVRRTKHLDLAGNADTMWSQYYQNGQFTSPQVESTIEYNASGNPTVQYFRNGSVSQYFYEDYFPANIQAGPQRQANITVFPNPTTNVLNLDWKDGQAGEGVRSQLLNAVGQLVYSESLNWMQATEQINIGNLPAGTYRLVVSDKAGAVMYQQAVVKQ